MSLVEPADDDASEVVEVHIIVATEPTELLVSDGAPSWAPVEGMDLLYMDNTDSDIPADSVNGAVLSQVAGTSQARAAILDNTIPQTAAIDRASITRYRRRLRSIAMTHHSAPSTMAHQVSRRSKKLTSYMRRTPAPRCSTTAISSTPVTMASGMSPTAQPDPGPSPPRFPTRYTSSPLPICTTTSPM